MGTRRVSKHLSQMWLQWVPEDGLEREKQLTQIFATVTMVNDNNDGYENECDESYGFFAYLPCAKHDAWIYHFK